MNIYLLTPFIASKGGIERVVINLANALCTRHKITIIVENGSRDNIAFSINANIEFIFLNDIWKKYHLKHFLNKLSYNRFINSLLSKENKNIVIENGTKFFPFIKKKNTKYFRLEHFNLEIYFKKYLNKLPLFFPRVSLFDQWILLSAKELQTAQKISKKISVIHNFLPILPSQNTDYAKKRIISIGRFSPTDQKGYIRLIELYSLIAKKCPDWELVLIGDGENKFKIEDLIKQKGLSEFIKTKPSTSNIEQEYLNASIYVMTSHFEGFPMVLLEAMGFGLPCIAYDVLSGPSDIIKDNQSGFLIPNNNQQSFAEKLSLLMNSYELREKMGKASKERIANHFTQEKILPQWERLFND